MFSLSSRSDVILALAVVAIVGMLLIPLPTMLLDLLLVLNISVALLLLLVGLYMPNALSLLSFPSLLLLTTLLRLGLNVASARLILTQGEAGDVIRAFGTFLIRGEVIVGIIIFTIITVVNYIVIAKGSSRVSEVAARFALDALPGKQLAIDSDMKSGLISPDEARRLRDELRVESQLYGSMDGAMQFVQGDAIAGFFIIFTNIVGGIYLGIRNGQSLAEAVDTYTVLTVGDGLVHQIPALMISICAGIVVTRVSSSERATLGADVSQQIFARPATVALAGGILVAIGLLPGLPFLPFFAIGAVFLFGSYRIRDRTPDSSIGGPSRDALGAGGGRLQEDEWELPLLELGFGDPGIVKQLRAQFPRYQQWWEQFRSDFFEETGLRLPEVSVVLNDYLGPAEYQLRVDGTTIESARVRLHCRLVEMNPEHAEALGFEVAAEEYHPLTGARVFWSPETPALQEMLEAAQLRSFDLLESILLRAALFFRHNPEEILSVTNVHLLLKQMEKRFPGLINDAFNREFIGVATFTDILQEVVRGGGSVRDFRQLLEAVAGFVAQKRREGSGDDGFELEDLVSAVRIARRRQLTSRFVSSRKSLRVVTLDSDLEEYFDEITVERGSRLLPVEPTRFEILRSALEDLYRPLWRQGMLPVAILCRTDLRSKVTNFTRSVKLPLEVITFDELEPSIQVERVGVWELEPLA